MCKKILVPVDSSPYSKRALTAALKIAKETGGKVTVLYVNHVSASFGGWMLAAGPMMWPPKFLVDGDELLKSILQDYNSDSAQIKCRVAAGYPVETIIKTAKQEEVDLVVMGTRGLGPLTGLLLGSISQRVVQDAPCPVLLVK